MNPMPRWLPFAIAAGVLAYGWHAMGFLCDDAFIAFRYVGNAHDGHGLCWNPPPFAPVEGYSCFLWVMLLWGVWEVTGVAPPASANWLALGFSLATLALLFAQLRRWGGDAPARGRGSGVVLTTLTLVGCATSPLFVTWASSGLETAMFGFFAVGWTFAACSGRGLARASTFAGLAVLTRPDGGLLVLATLLLIGHEFVRRRSVAGLVRGLAPLAVPAVHLVWRRWYYGEWVPNTYFAKVTAAWPESGLRYLSCFVFEHGIVLWLLVAAVFCAVAGLRRGALRRLVDGRFAAAVTVLTWVAFVTYYTAVVGGDHFGFRPFAHLVPLLFASLFAMLRPLRAGAAFAIVLAFAVGANAFGWRFDAVMRRHADDGFVRAAEVLPGPAAAFGRAWERQRAWLRLHFVALPRALHDRFCERLLELLPRRAAGQVEGLTADRRGVYRTVAAGVVGWSLPDVAILDAVGLNDRVVAHHAARTEPLGLEPAVVAGAFAAFDADRSAGLSAGELAALAAALRLSEVTGVMLSPTGWADLLLALCDDDGDDVLAATEFQRAAVELRDTRHMAHERAPPAGYVEALRPNVTVRDGRFVLDPSIPRLSDDEVRRVEREFWRRVTGR